MKNVLARGGIEFLAVLLGISGSLWLDDRSTFTQERKYEVEAYQRLSNALSAVSYTHLTLPTILLV